MKNTNIFSPDVVKQLGAVNCDDIFSEMDEATKRLAKSFSARLGLNVTKEHVSWAFSKVYRRGHDTNNQDLLKMMAELVRDAITSNLDIKTLLWEDVGQ
jgi:hypothetical protein